MLKVRQLRGFEVKNLSEEQLQLFLQIVLGLGALFLLSVLLPSQKISSHSWDRDLIL